MDEQTVEIQYKSKIYRFVLGWPSIGVMSSLYKFFYNDIGEITEEVEQTQFGINYVLAFIKGITVYNGKTGDVIADVDL